MDQLFRRKGAADPPVIAGVPLGGRDPLSSRASALETESDPSHVSKN